MPDFNSAEYYLFRAKELAEEAKGIFNNKEASADDLEKAQRMKEQAFEYQKRHQQLSELDTILNDKIADAKNEEQLTEQKRQQKPEETEFKSFGQFLAAIQKWNTDKSRDKRL